MTIEQFTLELAKIAKSFIWQVSVNERKSIFTRDSKGRLLDPISALCYTKTGRYINYFLPEHAARELGLSREDTWTLMLSYEDMQYTSQFINKLKSNAKYDPELRTKLEEILLKWDS